MVIVIISTAHRPEAGPPDPSVARSAAEFVVKLRELKAWAGLTYRDLEARARAAGDSLPYTTLSSALGRKTLPRERLVAAFVGACGIDQQSVSAWVEALRRLSMEAAVPRAGRVSWPAMREDERSAGTHGRLGQGGVNRLRAVTGVFQSIGDRYGGHAVVDQMLSNHERASRFLTTGDGSLDDRRRLLAALAYDAAGTAFSCFDAGRLPAALRFYERALELAESAGSVDVQVCVLMDLAFVPVRFDAASDDLRHAAQAAERACQLAKGLGSARVRAACAAREAYANARLHDRRGFERAMGRAVTALERGYDDNDPPWLMWFTESTMHCTLSEGWAALGEHDKALDHAERAVHVADAHHDAHYVRCATWRWLELALARVAAGEPDQGCHDALTGLRLSRPVILSELNVRLAAQFATAISGFRTRTTRDFLAQHHHIASPWT
ncbi:hypothetical protein [Nonomuraea sp. NPDC049400]|uniref:hypothetical protein n=1 Tax=Nonomuraea sp. NPDC049400 TaxID=3364352 RepID=UPI0037B966A7